MTAFVVIDTSFLSHALIQSQQSAAALEAMEVASRSEIAFLLPEPVMVEFLSFLRSSVVRSRIDRSEAARIATLALSLDRLSGQLPLTVLNRAWEIATRLGQSDVFDAYGYATAEWLDAELWTADKKFANAAAGAGLNRVRLAG